MTERRPVPPITLPDATTATGRLDTTWVDVDEATLARLRAACPQVSVEAADTAEASRDWWPLAMIWALDNQVAARAAVVARPRTAAEVAGVVAVCHEAGIPLTPAAGRSGVCGASVPVHGGVVLDLTDLTGINSVDDESLVVDVAPGTFGDDLERQLRDDHGLTLGHWPQSMALSTVGGWLACRSAGQLSNRYGKIEDLVVGLDVVLADGGLITTGGAPKAATGPDLTQLFVGSEGTLGVIVGARLRLRPQPETEAHAAFGFVTWEAGMAACRRILRRGANPAVLRLYDAIESQRSYQTGELNVLLVMDEGDPVTVEANLAIVGQECGEAERLDDGLVAQWLEHRNEVSALESLVSGGFVVDTMEVAAPWGRLDAIYESTLEALRAVPGVRAASAHQSHAYPDGACLYFTFAGRPSEGTDREAMYLACWDAGTTAVLQHGGALSHHHGVGLNRSRFMVEALGPSHRTLEAIKDALDPRGILNPGKLGLADQFGPVNWPTPQE